MNSKDEEVCYKLRLLVKSFDAVSILWDLKTTVSLNESYPPKWPSFDEMQTDCTRWVADQIKLREEAAKNG